MGAATVDMDQIQIHPTVEQKTSALITEGLRGDGAILVNAEGSRFCDEVGTRDAVSAAELAQTLRDAGCTEEAAAALMADVRDFRRLLELLARHRAALLDEVHKSEKKIDCLDYLIYRIKQNQHKREE